MMSRVRRRERQGREYDGPIGSAPGASEPFARREPVRPEALEAFVEELSEATCFEVAASAALNAALATAAAHLEGSRYARDARLLRAILHWRPRDAYRGVLVREPGWDGALAAEGDEFLISTAAWRTIAERCCPVTFDVETGVLEAMESREPARRATTRREPVGQPTRLRLQQRGVTHLFVLPLRGAGGSPLGMLSVEAECNAAIGRSFVWPAAAADLKVIASVAAPHLAQLPFAGGGEIGTDELLPVVGKSMAPIIRLLQVFARQDETLLLSGPTGTGKSRLATWCHHHSPRREGPFEVVDLLSVPDDMQMGELFGWRRGAFTGAASDHEGCVARAEGGTLFIDEIDKLSSRAQAGLLYLLEERRYRVLGDAAVRESDVRFIVGTNRELGEAVAAGSFREDLYYRINVLALRLPPLEDRRDEIADWVRVMLDRRHAEAGGSGTVALAEDGASLLRRSGWPGNLRQLDNVVRRAYVLALADGGTGSALEVRAEHVRGALAREAPGAPAAGGGNPLREVARLVAESARSGGGFDIDLLSGLRGLALMEAIRSTGSKEEAFRLLGREALVKSRNHHKTLQRELERAEELCRALGIAFEPADAGEEPDDR